MDFCLYRPKGFWYNTFLFGAEIYSGGSGYVSGEGGQEKIVKVMRRSVFRGGLAAGVVFVCAAAGAAFGQPWSGSGTAGDPYQIWTAADMQAIGADSNYWDANFRLEAHIDLGGYTGESFNIIGNTTVPFTGVFDGNSHKIFNFTYKSSNKDYVGLFGYIDDVNAEIRRIEIVEPNVDAGWGNNVGALAGDIHYGSARNCQVRGGRVLGDYCVGGLVGRSTSAELLECSTATTVWAHSSSIGGLGGAVANGLTSDCYSVGSITGSDKVGGLIGLFSSNGLIRNCFSAGAVSAPGYKGGLVGYHWDSSTSYYKCFWDSTVNPDMNGIGNRTDANVVGQTTANMHLMSTFTNAGWDFVGETANGTDDIWKIDDGNDYPKLSWQAMRYGGGSGDANDPYQIWIASDMQAIGASPNDWDKHFLLMTDIDLGGFTGAQFNIIGSSAPYFSGVFDGNDYQITRFTYIDETKPQVGLFGRTAANSEIQNVHLVDANLCGYYDVGGLVGKNYGQIKNCSVSGVIVANQDLGGVVGENRGWVERCKADVTIQNHGSLSSYVGGLVGWNIEGDIIDCSSAGMVYGNDSTDKVGGLIGSNRGRVNRCHSTAEVSGGWCIGGLVGDHDSYNLENCYAAGNVLAVREGGGLVGFSTCTVINCYATGDVNCTRSSGGLIGEEGYGGAINCYSKGYVNGNQDVGGLVGLKYTTDGFPGCFWDVNTSGQGVSAGGIGKTTTQMHTRSTFTDAGWDFVGEVINGPNDIWDICDGTNYPKLSWQQLPGDFACPDGVNLIDFSVLGAAWYSEPNDYNWDPNCDISVPSDNIIDERDLLVFTSNWLVGM